MPTPMSLRPLSWFRAQARTFGLLLLATLTLQACHHWVARPETTQVLVNEKNEEWVRVTLANGTEHTLRHPRIVDGLLMSESDTVTLADVRSTRVSRVSAPRTIALLAGIGATTLAIFAFGGSAGSSPPPPTTTISCPVVYSWNGQEWIMDSGTFGGAIARAFQRTDLDNLNFATPFGGVLRLKLANILDETEHVDALSVLAIDHDPGTSIAPDGAGTLHTLGALSAPLAARGFDGADALARVRTADGWNWESAMRVRDTSRIAEIRDGVELTFVRPQGAAKAHLVVDGNNTPWAAQLMTEMISAHGTATQAWYDTLNTRPDIARALGARMAGEAFLGASVLTSAGWTRQGIIWEAGPEIVKRQAMDIDLSQVVGDTVRVRLESAASLWLIDGVAIDFTSDKALTARELHATVARDKQGRDVRAALASIDAAYFTMEHGDNAELRFNVPPVPAAQVRSYLLKSNGWYRIHTPTTMAPNVALTHQIATEPFGISKAAVARMNEALAALSAAPKALNGVAPRGGR